MRKTAPVLLFTTVFALASGSALAMGDRHKEKKADSQTMSQPSGAASSTATPSSTASTSGAATKNKESRCDETKYASKSAMPSDCVDKTSPGAAGSGGSGAGSSSAAGSGSSGPGSSGASSSSSGK